MAFAQRVKSPKGSYWTARYQDPSGSWVSVRDERARVIRYDGKRAAEKAAGDAESAVRGGKWRDPRAGAVLFADWADEWYDSYDLAESTHASRRRHLENHLLPFFGETPLRDITPAMILRWKRKEKAAGASDGSIRTWHGTLHLILEDAVPRHIAENPATRKRGRGRRSGRGTSSSRAPERVITGPLGILLIAERAAILTGQDQEFVMIQALFWEALRLGECIGLEKPYVRPRNRPGTLRVEWQLHEVDGRLVRCPPKDDSRGTPEMPPFMLALLEGHLRRNPPQPCPCHGQAYVFRGAGSAAPRWNKPLHELAVVLGVSQTVVQSAMGGRGRVGAETRRQVLKAAEVLGYRKEVPGGGQAWHWRRSAFEGLFTAAASGWHPPKAPMPRRPVLTRGEWPGERVQGRNAEARAEMCWLPVAEGMTPHGTRHSIKTLLEERRIPEILSEAHMRHDIPGVSAVYRHVTPAMRGELAEMMTAEWDAALDARLELSPRSPVAVLDGLLRERSEGRRLRLADPIVTRISPEAPEAVLPFWGRTASDQRRGDRI
jgi:integrase